MRYLNFPEKARPLNGEVGIDGFIWYLSMAIRITRSVKDKIGINWECRLLLLDDYPVSLKINMLLGV